MNIHLLILLIGVFTHTSLWAGTPASNNPIPIEDSTVRVLVLQHKEKNKQHIFPAGTNVKYWLKDEKRPKKGTILGFVDNDLLIDMERIPLSDILKIRKIDTSAQVLLQIFIVLGGIVTGLITLVLTFYFPIWLFGFLGSVFVSISPTFINPPKNLQTKFSAYIKDLPIKQVFKQ